MFKTKICVLQGKGETIQTTYWSLFIIHCKVQIYIATSTSGQYHQVKPGIHPSTSFLSLHMAPDPPIQQDLPVTNTFQTVNHFAHYNITNQSFSGPAHAYWAQAAMGPHHKMRTGLAGRSITGTDPSLLPYILDREICHFVWQYTFTSSLINFAFSELKMC